MVGATTSTPNDPKVTSLESRSQISSMTLQRCTGKCHSAAGIIVRVQLGMLFLSDLITRIAFDVYIKCFDRVLSSTLRLHSGTPLNCR